MGQTRTGCRRLRSGRALAPIATIAVALAIAGPAAVAGAAPASGPVAATHYAGTLVDGSSWAADVPAAWNGTLLDFSHGLVGFDHAAEATDAADVKILLAAGYALVGSSFAPADPLWAFPSAIDDGFGAIQAVESSGLPTPPTNVIAVGESMGGLVSALMDEDSNGRLTGALNMCPVAAGGEAFMNYNLDGSYALNELLAPSQQIQLTGYTSKAQANTAGGELVDIAQTAQTTAAGRARLALVSALYNVTTWTAVNIGPLDGNPSVTPPPAPPPHTDYAEWEQEQYETDFAPGAFQIPYSEVNRFDIETAVGGQPSWDTVDYATAIDHSPYYPEVAALYKAAGLNLASDLATLTANANITDDANALSTLIASSDPTGQLQVPEIDLHTIADEIIPVQQENAYKQVVDAAGKGNLLGQGFIYSQGHCNFDMGEELAALQALEQRIATGTWGTSMTPSSLNRSARTFKQGPGSFIAYTPPALTGSNLP